MENSNKKFLAEPEPSTSKLCEEMEEENSTMSYDSEVSDRDKKNDPDFLSNTCSSKDEMKTSPHVAIKSNQMRVKLPTLAEACDRTLISDRSAAIIASSVLKDVGLITEENSSLVIDKNKIRRERKRKRVELRESTNVITHSPQEAIAIYFDGRKDKTLVQHQRIKDGTFHRMTEKEEHIVVLSEPDSKYLGHFSVASGGARDISETMMSFLKKNINLNNLVGVGCDGTAVNTGIKKGVIRRIETEIGHSVHWLICLLHLNELPLRHLMQHLDGETAGPYDFSGEIGKSIKSCEELPIVSFETHSADLPNVDRNVLSTDQKYLYDIVQGISTGHIGSSLASRKPGNIAHSRWLTTANRILRLYVGTINPPQKLKILVQFITKVYAPMWFHIKVNNKCKDGAIHLHNMINRSKFLEPELRSIVYKVIQTNGYFAHPESILIAMLCDKRRHFRELAVRRIKKARSELQALRTYKVPLINFNAESYIDMIDWQKGYSEPPLTKSLTEDDLQQLIDGGLMLGKKRIFELPCHSQAVERCIKLVTEASLTVCGHDARDGLIRSRISSIQKLPKFDKKADFTT